MLRWIQDRLERLSPGARQFLIGAGLAMDPLPAPRYHTFCQDDAEAMRGDWQKVSGDLRRAIERARPRT